MAVVACTVCDGKQFKNQEAYEQHARDNKRHKDKARVQTKQAGQTAAPNVATRSQTPSVSVGFCKTCKIDCGTLDGLQEHYDNIEFRYHPKCLRCGKGFLSHAFLEEHRKVAHPIKFCSLCQKYVYLEDWQKHEQESDKHRPSSVSPEPDLQIIVQCPVCMTPRDSEDEMKKHLFATHTELCCYTCGLTFSSTDLLAKHYQESDSHPKCNVCGLGFRDSLQCAAHYDDAHYVASPVRSQASLSEVARAQVAAFSPISCNQCNTEFDTVEEHEDHLDSHRTASTPPPDTVDIELPLDASASQSRPLTPPCMALPEKVEHVVPQIVEAQSTQDEEQMSVASSESLVDVDSPSSPSALRASSAPPSSALDTSSDSPQRASSPGDAWTSVRVSTSGSTSTRSASPRSPHPAVPELVLSQASPSPSPSPVLASVDADAASPASASATSYHSISRAASPHAVHSLSRISTLATYTRRQPSGRSPASESSSAPGSPGSVRSLLFTLGPAPRPAEASASESSDSSGPATPASARSVFSQVPIPEVRSEPDSGLRPRRPISRASIEDANVSPKARAKAKKAGAPAKPAVAERKRTSTTGFTPSTSTSASATRVPARTPSLASSSSHAAPPAKESHAHSRWTCRTCFGAPREPTVTVCGHLFCRSCIMAEIAKNLQCPVCRTVMLVRLHVD